MVGLDLHVDLRRRRGAALAVVVQDRVPRRLPRPRGRGGGNGGLDVAVVGAAVGGDVEVVGRGGAQAGRPTALAHVARRVVAVVELLAGDLIRVTQTMW